MAQIPVAISLEKKYGAFVLFEDWAFAFLPIFKRSLLAFSE